jgi:hypothetical protein
MTELEFQTAMAEFLNKGGVIEELKYFGPKVSDKTFVQKGYVASLGATKARLKEQGIVK